jgi:hypothetical protein
MPALATATAGFASTAEERRSLLTASSTAQSPSTRGVKHANEQHCWRKLRDKPAIVIAAISLVMAALTTGLILYWSTKANRTMTESFGQLATPVVWNAHVEACRAVQKVFTTDMVPEKAPVAITRKILLKTRNLLDVFSPVYPLAPNTNNKRNGNFKNKKNKNQKKKKQKKRQTTTTDWWVKVRLLYKTGYEIVGDFVDLSRAHIDYDKTTRNHRRQKVLAWKADFINSCPNNHNNDKNGERLEEYLRRPLTSRRQKTVRHSHESKFFWKNVPDRSAFWPSSAATSTLHRLVAHQLRLAQTFLDGTLSLQQHAQQQPPPTRGSSVGTIDISIIRNHTRAQTLATHETFHNLRKTLRALCDEYDLFGPWLFPLPSTTSAVIQNGTTTTPTAAAMAVRCLVKARTLLGDLNDDFTAYLFYVQHKHYRDQVAALVEQIDQKLQAFCEWTIRVDFAAQLDLLLHQATVT